MKKKLLTVKLYNHTHTHLTHTNSSYYCMGEYLLLHRGNTY